MLAELVQGGNIVLATGGGAVLSAAEPQAPRARTASSSTCARRLTTCGAHAARPQPAAAARPAEPLATLERLYAERDPLYREVADIIVDTGSQSLGSLAHRLEQQARAAHPAAATPSSSPAPAG